MQIQLGTLIVMGVFMVILGVITFFAFNTPPMRCPGHKALLKKGYRARYLGKRIIEGVSYYDSQDLARYNPKVWEIKKGKATLARIFAMNESAVYYQMNGGDQNIIEIMSGIAAKRL